MKQNKIYIYGKHAVREALRNAPRAVLRVHFSKDMKDHSLRDLAKNAGVPIEPFDDRKATSWVEGNASHQGAVALISLPNLMISYERWVKPAQNVSIGSHEPRERSASASPKAVVLLNEVQDPHNVGAVIRSAAAFGAEAVLMPEAKQAPVTVAVIKASAGMAFSLPLVSIGNIQKTISDLKKEGYRVYGLAGEGKKPLPEEKFGAKSLFIMGNESKGLPKSTADLCDAILSIPIEDKAESLNVAAAAAITLYTWHTRR